MRHVIDLVPMFKRAFELSKIKEDEVVALLTEPGTRPDYTDAAATAVRMLGAEAVEVSVRGLGWDEPAITKGVAAGVPALVRPSRLLNVLRDTLTKVDFIVDLLPEMLLHIPLREDILGAGVRVLSVHEPADVLERMFPTQEIKEAVLRMRRRIVQATKLHVTSQAGTDLRCDLIPGSGVAQYGMADEPGRWDHWPSALVSSYPVDGTAEGTVVLSQGDIIYPFKRFVESPVTIEVRDGYVRNISGGTDALLLADYLASWDEPEVYAVSHIAIGMHPRAQWTAPTFYDKGQGTGMDGRSKQGGYLFTTGPNRYVGRFVEAHLDIPMRGCTVKLDNEAVVVDGKLQE